MRWKRCHWVDKMSWGGQDVRTKLPSLAFLELTVLTVLVLVFPTVPLSCSLQIVMLEALCLPGLCPVSPEVLALLALGGAVPIKAEPLTTLHVHTGKTIFDIQIGWALPRVPRAELIEVAFTHRMATQGSPRLHLKWSGVDDSSFILALIRTHGAF